MSVASKVVAAAAVLLCMVGSAAGSAAQSVDTPLPSRPLPLEIVQLSLVPDIVVVSPSRLQELEQWTRDFDEWEKWTSHSRNRRDVLASFTEERTKHKPDPPEWLQSLCLLAGMEEPFVRPCQFLADWQDDPAVLKNRQASAVALKQREAPSNSSWWRHLHLDGMWSTTQSNVAAFGLFGAHATMEIEGRFQIFITPGIMMLSVPDLFGSRTLTPATDWGVTYRLFNVGQHTVHFNLAHAFMLVPAAGAVSSNLTLAGLSVSPRQH